MSAWLVVAVGLAYAYCAAEQAVKGNWSLAIIYGGYAISNIGLWKLT